MCRGGEGGREEGDVGGVGGDGEMWWVDGWMGTGGKQRLTFLAGSASANLLPGEHRSATDFLTWLSSSSTAF